MKKLDTVDPNRPGEEKAGPGSLCPGRVHSVECLLDRLSATGRTRDRVRVDQMLEAADRRSFGPLLLLAGLLVMSPLSGIPGVPTTMSIVVFLLAAQLLVGRSEFWLPSFVLRRSVPCRYLDRAVRFLRPVARFLDRLTSRRVEFLTRGPGVYAIAAICLLVAAVTPFLEIVPFVASATGAGLSVFGIALIAHDGILALLASSFFLTAGWFLFTSVVG